MRNLLIGLTVLISFGLTIINEPIDDVLDAVAGGTNPTYDLTVDSTAGVSSDRPGDEDDDDDDEYEDHEYEDDDEDDD